MTPRAGGVAFQIQLADSPSGYAYGQWDVRGLIFGALVGPEPKSNGNHLVIMKHQAPLTQHPLNSI